MGEPPIPAPADPGWEDERVARLVHLAAREFARSLQRRLVAENVTFSQWIFLRILWRNDGLSQRELSERAHLTEPTTHTALIRMEEIGLIVRRKVGGNRRRQHAFLTERGWQLRGVLEPLAIETNDLALAGLSAVEVDVLRRALGTIIRNLAADERAAAERGLRLPSTRSFTAI